MGHNADENTSASSPDSRHAAALRALDPSCPYSSERRAWSQGHCALKAVTRPGRSVDRIAPVGWCPIGRRRLLLAAVILTASVRCAAQEGRCRGSSLPSMHDTTDRSTVDSTWELRRPNGSISRWWGYSGIGCAMTDQRLNALSMSRTDRLEGAHAAWMEWARSATADEPPDAVIEPFAVTEIRFRELTDERPRLDRPAAGPASGGA